MTARDFIDQPRSFAKSDQLRTKVRHLIPGGAHTYSKGDDQFPERSPGFIARGQGSHVWDVDGNEFVDWGMGLRAVVLGHAYEPVLQAVRAQLELGANHTRPTPLEAELAEVFTEIIPSAEMVKFAKNGSDVTTAAVKLSRAYTGRDLVVRCQEQPFFSIDDWFIGDTPVNSGIPAATSALTKRFSYNDLASLEGVFDAHPGQIACVILEAAATDEPKPGFLQGVQALCRAKDAVLILDEMITGFRWDVRGAQHYYGVTPDLSTFGKAVGNGFSVGALVGRRDLMRLGGLDHDKERVFLLSTTHGGETHSLAAAKKTIQIMKSESVTAHLWKIGRELTEGFNGVSARAGLRGRVEMRGVPCSPYIVFSDERGQVSWELRTLFLQEILQRGILMPYIAPSYSHTTDDVALTLAACEEALQVVKDALTDGKVRERVFGPICKPVFRKWN
jgi:glutamate-1-semialdehyde 2,1-aminomutase